MDKNFIQNWLKDHKFCVLATSHKDKPWAATVNYTIDDNLNIYIYSREDSLKFQNIQKNPIVCLVIDGQTDKGTLQIQGVAHPIQKRDDANIIVKPAFLTFLKKEKSGKLIRKTLVP